MNTKKLTTIVVGAFILGLIGYDVFAFTSGGTEATVSWVIYEWSYKYPAFTFGMGFVMGHLFWQMKAAKKLE
jgi:hypothetical protein